MMRSILPVAVVLAASPAMAQIAYDAEDSFHDIFVSVTDFGDLDEGDYVEYVIPTGGVSDTLSVDVVNPAGNSGSATSSLTADETATGFLLSREATGIFSDDDDYFSAAGGGYTQYVFTATESTPFRLSGTIEVEFDNLSFSSVYLYFENTTTGTIFVDEYVEDPDPALDLMGDNALTGTLDAGSEYLLVVDTFGYATEDAGVTGFARVDLAFTTIVPEPASAGTLLAAVGGLSLRRRRAR